MPYPEDISDPTTAMNMAVVLMAKAFKLNYSTPTNNNHRISSNPHNRQIAQPGMNMGQDRQMQMIGGDIDEIEEVNANCILINVISVESSVQHSGGTVEQHPTTVEETRTYFESLYNNLVIEVEKVNMAKSREDVYFSNTSKTASVSNTISKPFSIHDDEFSNDAPSVARKFLYEVKDTIVTLQRVVKQRMNANVNNPSSLVHQDIHKIFYDEIAPIVNQVDARVQNFKNHFVKEAAKFVRYFKSLAKEADDSLDKIMVLEKENDLLLRAVVSYDIMSIVQRPTVVEISDLQTELERTSMNTKFAKHSILGKPPSSSGTKLYYVNPFPKSKVIPKVVETIALSKPVTSNSAPSTKESEIMKNDKVIAPGMFSINPLKTSRVENFMPNKPVKASVRTNPITTSQPHVITKKDVNSNLHSLSSTVIDNTAKTRRPRPRSNTKKDRVTSASKSSCIKHKEVRVEEHHRNLLLPKN
uniref:Integrase, catalytic region, zinc finger, CCHC-type, peptidase aspartic, catalytic n=1 Tax=Tanacetum cinerariifolium TaxID=118510 RepID=A0A6L2NRH7_TANCI|nr:hypothetical protein [Tanacetum cinerariifolium]